LHLKFQKKFVSRLTTSVGGETPSRTHYHHGRARGQAPPVPGTQTVMWGTRF